MGGMGREVGFHQMCDYFFRGQKPGCELQKYTVEGVLGLYVLLKSVSLLFIFRNNPHLRQECCIFSS